MSLWRAHGALLGLAVGDALGAPLEFKSPDAAAALVSHGLEMTGGGIWRPGEWTDDTAMALALAESIGECGLLDIDDVARRYIAWADSGPKDIGNTTRAALQGASDAADATERARVLHEHTGRTAGNGTVMRCTPIAFGAIEYKDASEAARTDALLTHHDPAAGLASATLCGALIDVGTLEDPFDPMTPARRGVANHPKLAAAVNAAAHGDEETLARLAEQELGACWTALAIGLFAVENFRDFESGVSWAISLGGDTDTNGAVAGALLGCRDGVGGIPARWRDGLRDIERIENAVEAVVRSASRASGRSFQRGAHRWPEHEEELGHIGCQIADERSAVAMSRGKLAKSYAYVHPNEDGVLAYIGAEATLIVLADGHNGRESTRAAMHFVVDELGDNPPPALTDDQLVSLFHGAGEAVLAVTQAPGAENPESRTTLIVGLISHRKLTFAAMGDSALVISDGTVPRRLDIPRRHFVGWPMTVDEVGERLVRGREDLESGEWVVAMSDGFTDFAAGGPAAVDELVRANPGNPSGLAQALVEAAFDGGAGDNVAVAVTAPFDAPFAAEMRPAPPERTFPS